MAKRFTDTKKWQPWFRNLPCIYKLFWVYLCDFCDSSGVWEYDEDHARFNVDRELNPNIALKYINEDKERILILPLGKKWLLMDFIHFQYGCLRKNNKVHAPIYRDLLKHGIDPSTYELKEIKDYTEALQSLKEKEKEEYKEKEMEKEEEREKPKIDSKFNQLEAFNKLWAEYPAKGRLQRSASIRKYCEIVVRREESLRIQTAVKKYSEHLKANSEWSKRPKNLVNWLDEWSDWENHSVEEENADNPRSSLEKLREIRAKRVLENS